MRLSPGTEIDGRYALVRPLGAGGMGEVWEAEDLQFAPARRIALKFQLANAGVPKQQERILRETNVLAGLKHPNIVTVYGWGEHDDRIYFAMELLHGRDLSQHLAQGPLSLGRALWIASEVADAVACGHESSLHVVHRDIKPSNIFIAEYGHKQIVKVLDFGIAKPLEGFAPVTTAGPAFGTVQYMPPEYAVPVAAQPPAAHPCWDVYSIGATLYECLAGHSMYRDAQSHAAMLIALHKGPPPSVREACHELPDEVATVVDKAIAYEPGARYQDARALWHALEQARIRASGQALAMVMSKGFGGTTSTEALASSAVEALHTPPRVAGELSEADTVPAHVTTQRPALARVQSRVARRTWSAAAVTACIALAGMGWVFTKRPSLPSTGSTASAAALVAAEPAGVLASDPPITPSAPAPVFWTIVSDPAEADIEVEGRIVCQKTPCQVARTEAPQRVIARARGHHPRTFVLDRTWVPETIKLRVREKPVPSEEKGPVILRGSE